MERLKALDIRNRSLVTALFTYDDIFLDSGLRKLSLEQALHLYLAQNGYETIVFYSTDDGFYSFDAEMLGRFLSEVNTPLPSSQNSPQDVVVDSSPAGHSSGRRKFTRSSRNVTIGGSPKGSATLTRQTLNTMPDPYGRFKTRSTGDRTANLAEFDYNLRERRHLALVVMSSVDAPEFESTQTSSLDTSLTKIEEYGRLQSCDNRLIVVIKADNCRENVMKCFNDNRSVFLAGSFKKKFTRIIRVPGCQEFEALNPETTVVLEPPTKTDIIRALMLARVETGIEKSVAWQEIEDICEQLSLISRQLTMMKIQDIMMAKHQYSYGTFKENGVKKRGENLNSLNQLIGLQGVKEQIQEFKERLQLQRRRGGELSEINMHMVFYGNPGTGKTTVARIMAGILKDMGLLSKGHLVEVLREDLVAGFVGQTAPQTSQVIDSALDGVLFIDEAYRLADGGEHDFGRDAINTLLARMENDRHRLAVILAGYEHDMQRLFNVNPGLASRAKNRLYFKDYNADELKQIFLLLARKYYTITPEVDQLLDEMMTHVVAYKIKRYEEQDALLAQQNGQEQSPQFEKYSFGNGRWVRNLFESVEGKVAKRQIFSDVSVLLPQDFEGLKLEELQGFVPGQSCHEEEHVESGLEKLEKMIGLDQMKKEVVALVKQAQYARMLQERGKTVPTDSVCRHMIFLGNPGTGKTTVARIMAEIYYELGLLEKKTIVEVDRSKLVGQFLGHTAPRVNQIFDSALGGVLLIDEAYGLITGREDTFGHEALNTLVKRIEDDKDKLVVILTGYEYEMRQFIAQNTGLSSRFNTYIHFEDYSTAELYQILLGFLREQNIETTAETEERLAHYIDAASASITPDSGNGRWARNLADKIRKAHVNHCVDIADPTAPLAMEVVEQALRDFEQSRLG